MKRIYIIALSACILSSVVSCSFLKEQTFTSLENVYDTEIALETDVRGIIRGVEDTGYVGEALQHLQFSSALVHWNGTTGRINDERWGSSLRQLNYSSMTTNLKMYTAFYSAINNCNVLLQGLETSPVDKDYKKEIEGETKFYRAFLYFSLVRLYGDVPLALSAVSTSDQYRALPRESYYKVYAQIVTDLKDAWAQMRTPERVTAVTGTQGRPNKWAAKALLSAVYLNIASILTVPQNENFYDETKPGRKPDFFALGINDAQKAWELTLSTAEDVIENGPYRLAKNFGDLFKWTAGYIDAYGKDSWNLDERILVIQGTGTNTANYCSTRTLMQYPEGAQVPPGTTTTFQGGIRPTRFFFQKWCETMEGEMGTSDLQKNIYVDCDDPRLKLSLFYGQFTQCSDGANVKIYPNGMEYTMGGLRPMPFYKKYLTPTYKGIPDVADFYLMRFAEVYYIAAEAAVRLNRQDDAYDFIEKVHSRARSSADGATHPKWVKGSQFSTDEEFVNAIVWDKLFELCGEGHEFFEVRRLGAKWFMDQVVTPVNEFLRLPEQIGDYVDTFYGRNFQYSMTLQQLRGSLLCEFPREELTMNSAMTANDKNDFSWE